MKIITCYFILSFFLGISVDNKPKEIEIYALPFYARYTININKKGLRENYDLRIKIKDEFALNEWQLNNLKVCDSLNYDKFKDYRAIVIMNFGKGKKREFLVSCTGHIIEKHIVYEYNSTFLKRTYAFFPKNYFPFVLQNDSIIKVE